MCVWGGRGRPGCRPCRSSDGRMHLLTRIRALFLPRTLSHTHTQTRADGREGCRPCRSPNGAVTAAGLRADSWARPGGRALSTADGPMAGGRLRGRAPACQPLARGRALMYIRICLSVFPTFCLFVCVSMRLASRGCRIRRYGIRRHSRQTAGCVGGAIQPAPPIQPAVSNSCGGCRIGRRRSNRRRRLLRTSSTAGERTGAHRF